MDHTGKYIWNKHNKVTYEIIDNVLKIVVEISEWDYDFDVGNFLCSYGEEFSSDHRTRDVYGFDVETTDFILNSWGVFPEEPFDEIDIDEKTKYQTERAYISKKKLVPYVAHIYHR